MAKVFLAGHGSWTIKDGYTTVPKGCSIDFYTDNAKNMFTTDMFSIVAGTYASAASSTVGEFKTCPNYRLYPDNTNSAALQNNIEANATLYMTNQVAGEKLSDIIGRYPAGTQFVWCCCRYNDLKEAGGKSVGVNAGQNSGGYFFNPSQLKNTGGFWVANSNVDNLAKNWDPLKKQ
jgi:hypothetical protein